MSFLAQIKPFFNEIKLNLGGGSLIAYKSLNIGRVMLILVPLERGPSNLQKRVQNFELGLGSRYA